MLVLSTLAEDVVVAVPVSVGMVATVTCKIIKEDTDFSISWRMDDQKVCDEDTPTNDITCSTNATHGVLQLENTTSLGVGNQTTRWSVCWNKKLNRRSEETPHLGMNMRLLWSAVECWRYYVSECVCIQWKWGRRKCRC